MHMLESIRIALSAIWSHKLRSFLVMLGNVIAVTSIIGVVSIVDGMNSYMHEKVFQQGSGLINVVRFDEMLVLTDLDAFLESLHNPPITMKDRDYLRDKLPSALHVGASRTGNRDLTYGSGRLRSVPIRGYTADYPYLHQMTLTGGRHFTEFEVARSKQVVVIGSAVAEEFFPGLDPLGRKIKIGNRPFRVIGVTEEKGSLLGSDQDTFAAIPLSSFGKLFGRHGGRRSVTITVMAADMKLVPQLEDELTLAMRQRHRLTPGDRDDFALTSSEALMGLWDRMKGILLGVLMMIVGISVVVAGIVIMNIMLVSVQERTREIGVRKAIGARAADILWQFLVEALTLSMSGGVLGILLGYGLAATIASASPLPYAARLWSVILGLTLTVAVGALAGIIPARRAARLDPVEALRYE
jgi:putative ABC transport system permease protein